MNEINTIANIIIDTFSIALILILFFASKKVHKTDDQKLYELLLLTNIAIAFIDATTWIVDDGTFKGAREISLITNGILYAFAPSLGFVWLYYIDHKVYGEDYKSKKKKLYYAIPFFINIIICFITLFYPIYFHIDSSNRFVRNEPYSYIPFALAFFYVVCATIIIIKNKKTIHPKNFYPLLMYMVIPIICMIFQIIFYGLTLMYCGFALSMVIIYANVQNDINTTDYLTGLGNRRHLEIYLKNETRFVNENISLYGIMIDIDHFKSINDTYGHSEGDHALEIIGNILIRGTRTTDFIARYAGDEFVVITKLKKMKR